MKRTIKTLLAGGALLAVAGTANATDINIYGASAEFNFWKVAAANFIINPSGFACNPALSVPAPTGTTQNPAISTDGKHGVIQGNGCTSSLIPDGKVTIRFSNKASYDGIYSVLGSTNTQADTTCGSTAGTWPTGPLFQRHMGDLPPTGTVVLTTSCYPVTVGASDVPSYAFVQTSSGHTQGPNPSNTATVSRNFGASGIDTTPLTAGDPTGAGLPWQQPVKVPFAFWVNNQVTAKTCATGPRIGDYCSSDLDCSTVTSPSNNGTCGAATTINNMSREMANQLFDGQIKMWTDFGAGFVAQPVTLCYRHAGSGTHATVDLAVMNHGGWGKPLLTKEVSATSTKNPVVAWFNDATGDEAYCLQNVPYSVGYLDSDYSVGTNTNIIGPMKYNGSYPSASNIINGIYDMWADQSLYIPNSIDSTSLAAATALVTYLNNGANLDANGYHQYWAASSEMKVIKDTEFLYPHRP